MAISETPAGNLNKGISLNSSPNIFSSSLFTSVPVLKKVKSDCPLLFCVEDKFESFLVASTGRKSKELKY
jgi:hypothetical protein